MLAPSASAELTRGPDTPLPFAGRAAIPGDFDRNGTVDLAMPRQGEVTLLGGVGDATFEIGASKRVPNSYDEALTADLDRDGNLDLAISAYSRDAVFILFGRGDGTFGKRLRFPVADGPADLAVGRLNRDRRPDLAVAAHQANEVTLLRSSGRRDFRRRDLRAGVGPKGVAIAQLDDSPGQDLAIATRESVLSKTKRRRGGFKTRDRVRIDYLLDEILASDLDGDGDRDLVVTNISYGDTLGVHLLSGEGNGRFRVFDTYGTDSAPRAIAVGEFTGDGERDVVTVTEGYPGGTLDPPGYLVTLIRQPGEEYAAVEQILDGYGAYLAAGDLNEDGTRDVAVVAVDEGLEIETFLNG